MEETFVPFRGIKNDLRGRLLCYKQDWTGGLKAGIRFVNLYFSFEYRKHDATIVVSSFMTGFKLIKFSVFCY